MADNRQHESPKAKRRYRSLVRDVLAVVGFGMFAVGMWNIDRDYGLIVVGAALCVGMCLIDLVELKVGKRKC